MVQHVRFCYNILNINFIFKNWHPFRTKNYSWMFSVNHFMIYFIHLQKFEIIYLLVCCLIVYLSHQTLAQYEEQREVRESAVQIIWGKSLPGRGNKSCTLNQGDSDVSEELQEQYSCSGKNKRESTVAEKVKGSRMEGSVGHQNDSGCRFCSKCSGKPQQNFEHMLHM